MDTEYISVLKEVRKWMGSKKLNKATKQQMWRLLKKEKKRYAVRIQKNSY